ncbi:MAG: YraN family protein [Candidatus Omnitrophica bacterium]|nr:YraN family protein [Candidatus Omnitrophota bacterium]
MRAGETGETLAASLLKKRGYRLVERRYRTALGEIDLIGWDGQTLCFIEVKSRRSLRAGRGFESVDRRKRRRLARCALYYLTRKGLADQPARFDVVSVDWVQGPENPPEIQLIQNAFELEPEA